MPKKLETLIGVAEASELTGLDRRTIHRKAERGEIEPVSKLPGLRGAYIFNRSDLLAILLTPTAPVTDASSSDSGVSPVGERVA